jgi:hypothetical protein
MKGDEIIEGKKKRLSTDEDTQKWSELVSSALQGNRTFQQSRTNLRMNC